MFIHFYIYIYIHVLFKFILCKQVWPDLILIICYKTRNPSVCISKLAQSGNPVINNHVNRTSPDCGATRFLPQLIRISYCCLNLIYIRIIFHLINTLFNLIFFNLSLIWIDYIHSNLNLRTLFFYLFIFRPAVKFLSSSISTCSGVITFGCCVREFTSTHSSL